MESIDNPNQTPPPVPVVSEPKRSRGIGWKIFFGIILGISILANVILFFTIIVMVSVMMAGGGGKAYYNEKLVQEGPSSNKIVIINIAGIIDNKVAEQVEEQIKTARKDKNIKALIFRTMTPGGAVAASDRIYYWIKKYRKETGNPAVAFMDTLAASGGYYTSAACDKIIAEPTVITGSIGVVMGHFVFQDLLEQKLGIKPTIVKSGPKKDWPTSFEPVTEEQIAYLNDKLIMPTYERFVGIVAESRKENLSIEQVRELADGSIYNAQEALDNKLIDQIGYLPDAIELAKSLADIKKAKVVVYEKPFTIESIFGAETLLKQFTNNALYELTTPKLMYLWSPPGVLSR